MYGLFYYMCINILHEYISFKLNSMSAAFVLKIEYWMDFF